MAHRLTIFQLGFQYGQEKGYMTPREAEEVLRVKYPPNVSHLDVDVFLNGVDDGVVGDTTRLGTEEERVDAIIWDAMDPVFGPLLSLINRCKP